MRLHFHDNYFYGCATVFTITQILEQTNIKEIIKMYYIRNPKSLSMETVSSSETSVNISQVHGGTFRKTALFKTEGFAADITLLPRADRAVDPH